MLKTSPMLAASPNASPTVSFRHAPGRRSSQESPRKPVPMSRRPSSLSAASAQSPPLTTRPVVVDGPVHQQQDAAPPPSTAQQPGPGSRSAQQTPAEPPPAPHPQPMTASSSATTLSQPSAAVPAQDGPASNPLSPNKRRGSPSHAVPEAAAAAAGQPSANRQDQPASETAKRLRPERPPTKILPQRYELCAVEDIVELIAHMIAELIATNDAIRISNGGLTRFHSRTAPGISVRDYLHRLARHATLTPPLLLAMVYYIDRLCALYQEFTINTLTVHRFLITAATVATKGLSDSFWNNTTYARVGGVRVAELKLLELEFLHRVDWKIVPNPEVLVAYYRGLVERTPGYALESEGSSDEELSEDIDGIDVGDPDGGNEGAEGRSSNQ